MPINAKALELENKHVATDGAPTLARAYELLRDEWRAGERDRELALHLFFLAWYLIVEPAHLTGLDEKSLGDGGELKAVISDVHDWLLPKGAATDDAEAIYVVGLPATMFPWVLGENRIWEARGDAYLKRYRQLAPNGLDPDLFEGRGAYGDYYAGQVGRRDLCPCCGYLTLGQQRPGSFEICPVCCWEDDAVQARDPEYAGGANAVSLRQAQANFRSFGASDSRFRRNVRRPNPDEVPPGSRA